MLICLFPRSKPEIDWEAQYERQLRINEILITENKQINKIQDDNLEAYKNESGFYKNRCQTLESDYAAYKESSQERFRFLKADIINSLSAIYLCLVASVNTEKQQLTHRARNFRMRHVNQIIANEIDRYGDRKLISYEDDF